MYYFFFHHLGISPSKASHLKVCEGRIYFPFKNLVNRGLPLKQQSNLNYNFSNKAMIILYRNKKNAQKKINKTCFLLANPRQFTNVFQYTIWKAVSGSG